VTVARLQHYARTCQIDPGLGPGQRVLDMTVLVDLGFSRILDHQSC
jgi:hypothetical protein